MSAATYEADELLPSEWGDLPGRRPIHTFNAAVIERAGGGYLFAYRMVGGDGRRRIAAVFLGFDLKPCGSPIPLSDRIRFPPGRLFAAQAREWFADPRLYRIGGRLHLYWNSGWHEHNSQFLQAFGDDLEPIGFARELTLPKGRRTMEKNWLLFGEEPVYALYSPCPQRVLELDLSRPDEIPCREVAAAAWDTEAFAARYGELRGGAPPRRRGDSYYAICHSVFGTPGEYRYVPSVYRFSAAFPFAPEAAPAAPLDLGAPEPERRRLPKLNPAVGQVIYPCGAVIRGDEWLVSYGINDERVGLSLLPHRAIEAALTSASPDPTAAT